MLLIFTLVPTIIGQFRARRVPGWWIMGPMHFALTIHQIIKTRQAMVVTIEHEEMVTVASSLVIFANAPAYLYQEVI
jgi:hypothetical protein